MIPKTLSASAAQTFMGCEARYNAEYMQRVPRVDGESGLLGTMDHAVLEAWISQGLHKREWATVMDRERAMRVIYDMTYYDYFSSKDRYDEGWHMVNKWVQRTDWTGREVLSTEVKETFELPTSVGIIPVTYIFDRADHLIEENAVEVVDYKTVILPVQPGDLKNRIQPRVYSVAAAIKYKWATSIWVSYDLLRYDVVSAKFERKDNIDTWNFLKQLAERIIASDGTKEILNSECRFCVRKHVCDTLMRHGIGGGVLGITNMDDAADRRAQLEMARNGLSSAISELDDMILNFCEDEGIYDYSTSTIDVKIKVQSRRHADSERVAKIIGPTLMQKYGKVGVTELDTIIKCEDLTDEQKSALKQTVRKQAGNPRVETKLKSVFEED